MEAARDAVEVDRASLWIGRGDALALAAAAPAWHRDHQELRADRTWITGLDTGQQTTTFDGARHPLRGALGGGSGVVLDVVVLGADGRTGVLCLERDDRARPFDRADQAQAATLADRAAVLLEFRARDQAERELADAACRLHEAQRLQALGRLTSGVAHDFNNALTAILGGVQLVADGLPEDSDLRPSTARTLDAIGFASDLASQLLDFSRGEHGHDEFAAVDPVLERIRHLLRTLLGDSRRLEIRSTQGLPPVRCSATHLAQVVLNLVANARDALPDGGEVEIVTSSDDRHVVLRVTDNGVGIPDEVRARIFEPLFTTKPVGQGCGLGLATVHRIIAEAGGTVSVSSTIGVGTTFEIRLPHGS